MNSSSQTLHSTNPRRSWPLVLMVVGAILLLTAWSVAKSRYIVAQDIYQSISGVHSVRLGLDVGVAQLNLSAGASSGSLIEGRVESYSNEHLEPKSRQRGDQLVFNLVTHESGLGVGGWFGRRTVPRWDLRLAPNLPIDLHISSGVGESYIDLEELTLSKLEVSAGIGQTTLTLPRVGNFSGEVSSGIGAVVVRVPAKLPLRIRSSSGLGKIKVFGAFKREGDEYVSENYAAATNKVNLELSSGIGQISVEIIP